MHLFGFENFPNFGPLRDRSLGIGVAVDVLKAGHGDASLAPILREHAVVVNKRHVFLPAALERNHDGFLLHRRLLHASQHVVVQVLLVHAASHDVLAGQPLQGLVLAHDGALGEVQSDHAFGTDSGHVHQVVGLLLEQVNDKQVVAKNLNLFGNGFALGILVGHSLVDPAVLAVAVPAWGCGACDCGRCVLDIHVLEVFVKLVLKVLVFCAYLEVHHLGGQRYFLLGVVSQDLPTQHQRVGDLAEVGALRADAGVLAVHLGTGIRAFDLSQLLLHTRHRVRVHVAQLNGMRHTVFALLGP